MQKNFKWWAWGIVLFFSIFGFVYSNFANNEQTITQGELAQMLGEKMDLEVPEGTGSAGCIEALNERGIRPADGWKADEQLTKPVLDYVFAGVARLQSQVAAGEDPQAALKKVGVVLPSVVTKEAVIKATEETAVKKLFVAPIPSEGIVPAPEQAIVVTGTAKEATAAAAGAPAATEKTPLVGAPSPQAQEAQPASAGGGT